jgi:general secretion pathway protein A
MYCDYYGFVRRPFEMTPDPTFLFLGEAHREGLATLVYGVQSGKGFVLLTGEVGTGKTTLLHALLAQLDSSTAMAFIFNPILTPLDFFEMLFREFGIKKKCKSKAGYLVALNDFLIGRLANDQQTLLIIDEAQNLSPEMLEEVRLLSNLETSTSKLLQIMLVGQPELNELLSRPELRQLRQRIALRHHLRPLNEKELRDYVAERLARAGYIGKEIFKRSAVKELFSASQGIPRIINNICDAALLLSYAREVRYVDAGVIQDVVVKLALPATDYLDQNYTGAGAAEPRRRRFLSFLR